MNLRPSGYEPDELPDCSTPRLRLLSNQTAYFLISTTATNRLTATSLPLQDNLFNQRRHKLWHICPDLATRHTPKPTELWSAFKQILSKLQAQRRANAVLTQPRKLRKTFYFFRVFTALVSLEAAVRVSAFTERCSSAAMKSLMAGYAMFRQRLPEKMP